MSEPLDVRNLSQKQMEKLPMDVRTGLRSRMNSEARQKARQILNEDPAPLEPTIPSEKDNGYAMEEEPVQRKKKRKLPPLKKSEDSAVKNRPKRPGSTQKTAANQFGSTKIKKKFTVQITERVVREFKNEALKRGLNYPELAERAFTNIFITPGKCSILSRRLKSKYQASTRQNGNHAVLPFHVQK